MKKIGGIKVEQIRQRLNRYEVEIQKTFKGYKIYFDDPSSRFCIETDDNGEVMGCDFKIKHTFSKGEKEELLYTYRQLTMQLKGKLIDVKEGKGK